MANAFDFEIDIHGARVVAARLPLMPACLDDGTIDANIRALKDDLDAVAVKIKQPSARRPSSPIFEAAVRLPIAVVLIFATVPPCLVVKVRASLGISPVTVGFASASKPTDNWHS